MRQSRWSVKTKLSLEIFKFFKTWKWQLLLDYTLWLLHWGSDSSHVEGQEELYNDPKQNGKKPKQTTLEENEIMKPEQELTVMVCYCTDSLSRYFL